MKNRELIDILSNLNDDVEIQISEDSPYIVLLYNDNILLLGDKIDYLYKYNKNTKKYENIKLCDFKF